MKFSVITLGCKVNSYESESYIKSLTEHGYQYVSNKEEADIYLVNSCAVTNAAALKTRQKVSQAKKINPGALIVMIGCYPQVATDDLKKNADIDLLIGNNHKDRLVELIAEAQKGKKIVAVDDNKQYSSYTDLAIDHFSNQKRAFLKIQDGCNQFCSYCIIPYARGRERSLPMATVIKHSQQLVAHGHKEIVLSGINTGRYGLDIDTDISTLINEIADKVTSLQRLRISSIEVNEVSDNMIDSSFKHGVVARHWHIPLQSGSDKILKLMNRKYTRAQYRDKIAEIRNKLGDVAISADVIVGFPGESEEDFNDMYDYIQSLDLAFLHVFPFSPKTNTVAAKMDNQLPGNIKKERVNKLIALSEQMKNAYMTKFTNQEVTILVENEVDGEWQGYASEYFLVRLRSSDNLTNTMTNVIIKEVKEGIAYGEQCD